MPGDIYMKINIKLLLSILLLSVVIAQAGKALIKVGEKAPYFKVMDGYERWNDSSALQGKLIVGYYENRDTIKKNKQLKDTLNKYYTDFKEHTEGVVYKLAVVDASEANFTTNWVWRRKIREASIKEGFTVYGDWDGSMKKAYGFPANESTFIIIDKKEIVRYIWPGKVPDTEFDKIKKLLKQLM